MAASAKKEDHDYLVYFGRHRPAEVIVLTDDVLTFRQDHRHELEKLSLFSLNEFG